mmetsp:Transcript_18267/g.13272  ORF Transcript_18267/g.13272 Transcript_18267/m.13272 type:complete len:108 (-) Transcript_18267:1238-1561(-)
MDIYKKVKVFFKGGKREELIHEQSLGFDENENCFTITVFFDEESIFAGRMDTFHSIEAVNDHIDLKLNQQAKDTADFILAAEGFKDYNQEINSDASFFRIPKFKAVL